MESGVRHIEQHRSGDRKRLLKALVSHSPEMSFFCESNRRSLRTTVVPTRANAVQTRGDTRCFG